MTRREYTAGLPTTLATAFNVGNPDFTVTAATNWPTSNDYDFFVTIDGGTPQEERVLCSGRSGTVITVATTPSSGRGKDNTGEKNHAAGATVWPSWSAQDADEANAHINAASGVHNVTGSVVGTTDSQVLTNKTISSANNTMTVAQSAVTNLVSDLAAKAPIASPTFTGTVGGVTKAMVGLSNVDNTSDANKPISSATQTALDGKSGTGHGHDYAASAHGHDYAATGHGHSYLPLSGGTVSGNIEANFYYSSVGFQSAGGTIETLGGGPIQTNGVEITGTIVRPRTGNTGSVGSSGQRFNYIYLVNQPNVSSDRRLKSEITESELGLDFINGLNPVSYKLATDEENRIHYGLIAQDVKQAIDGSGVSDFAGWIGEDESDPDSYQSLAYGEFTAPMIKAIQELSAQVEALKAQLNQS